MARKKTKTEKKKSLLQIALCELLGLALIILPLLIYASLFSYDMADSSFNKVSSSAEINNKLGLFGAYSADAVLSTFGLALIIFLIVPIFWGIGLIRYQAFAEYKMRIFAWLVGLLCFSAFIDLTFSAYLGRFNLPYNLTGEWSRVVSRPLNSYINLLNISYNTFILKAIILFISILSFNFAAGLTFTLWLNLTTRFIKTLHQWGSTVVNLLKKLVNIRNFSEFKELNPSYLQSKLLQNRQTGQNIRREPKISASEPAEIPPVEPAANASVTSSLTIEIPPAPQQKELATAGKNSFNPTFDFINEGDAANQNTKKTSKNITPEDIYRTEGTKSSPQPKIPAKTEKPHQEELLAVKPVSSSAGQPLQSQIAATEKRPEPGTKKQLYHLPDINLLSVPKESNNIVYDENTLKQNAVRLEEVLKDFGIRGKIVKVRPGPVVTLYELEPAPGTRTARVIGLSDDIARSMAVASVRMAVVIGRNTIGIELPNEKRQTVWLRELLEDKEFTGSKNILNVSLGKDIGGQHVYADLSKMPHLLVAGTTGSGKSVGVNSMILSLLYRMTP